MDFLKDKLPQILKIALVCAVLAGLVVVGWKLWHRTAGSSVVDSYKTCVDAGNAVQTSYPSVCVTKDGKRFVGPSDQAAPPVPQPPYEGSLPQAQ